MIGWLAVLLCAGTASAQPPAIRADAVPDRKSATLSQPVRVTLTLEGPAPLLVKLPEQLLTADADSGWRIRTVGPVTKPQAGPGREAWQQVYRLDPYAEGALVVSFNPVTVNGQPVTWPPVAVTVTKTVGEDAKARPVTPPEDVKPRPIDPPRSLMPMWVAVAFGQWCLVVAILVWLRKRKAKLVPPGEWALAALAKLEASETTGAEAVEQIAAILRRFIERRFAIPATKLTTAELSATAREQEWPAERADPLGVILEACDRAKFAGDVPEDGGRQLVRLAVDWVNAAYA